MMLDSEKQSTAKPTFPKINLPLYSYRGVKEGKEGKKGGGKWTEYYTLTF